MLSHSEKIFAGKNDFIILYRGTDKLDRKFFAYIRSNKDGLLKMRNDRLSGAIVPKLDGYGTLIYYDYIENPDARAEQFMKDWLERNR